MCNGNCEECKFHPSDPCDREFEPRNIERQYDKIMRLIKETTDKFKELNENLKGEQQHEITPEEHSALQLELLRFTVTIKEFGK